MAIFSYGGKRWGHLAITLDIAIWELGGAASGDR